MNIISSSKTFQSSKWTPFLTLILSLIGIIFLKWDYQNIIILFVSEVFLMLTFAIIKMFFAMNNLPFYKTILEKLVYLVFGIFIGGFFMVFSVMFVSKSIQMDVILGQVRKIKIEIYVLAFGYLSNFFVNYLANQKFKEALPMFQMSPFIHVLVILGVLQGFTGHLLPQYAHLDQAIWGIVALIIVKFLVDLMFAYFRDTN